MTDPRTPPSAPHPKRHWLGGGVFAAITALLAACGVKPSSTTSTPTGAGSASPSASKANSPRAYRTDAARHLYHLNAARIYQGQLPPMLYAVGTLEVNLGRKGEVRSFNWLRKPSHAPEVVREIERTVRAAAPFPVAQQLGYVTYTDTWLWDRSGKFQLDTLTEGQRD
jgi:periplasmic protein TonB